MRLLAGASAALLLAAMAAAGWQWRAAAAAATAAAEAKQELSDVRLAAASSALEQAEAYAEKAEQLDKKLNEVIRVHTDNARRLDAAARAAAAADLGLRRETDRLAARGRAAAADPALGAAGQAASAAAAVLAELLGRCSSQRAELADYADRARLAGGTCELSYKALTGL